MKVTVFSTKGKKRSVVNAEGVTTWGELKSLLREDGIETDNMKAIIGENQVTLESTKAILPADFDFTLFLTPIKVKNGSVVDVNSMTYKECRDFIKSNGGSDKFGNYTQLSTDKMRTAIKGFLAVNSNTEEVVEHDAMDLIDNCIEALERLKEMLSNNQTSSVKVDEEALVEALDSWYEQIVENL